jgi:hypothetical protein
MAFRFRKSFKILPGVRLNVGSKGISSVSIGKRGASVSVGKSGTYVNAGIPGTGLSYREKINASSGANSSAGGGNGTSIPAGTVPTGNSHAHGCLKAFAWAVGIIFSLSILTAMCDGPDSEADLRAEAIVDSLIKVKEDSIALVNRKIMLGNKAIESYNKDDYKTMKVYIDSLGALEKNARYYNINGLYYKDGKKHFKTALASFDKAISMDTSQQTYVYNKALALISLKRNKEAIPILRALKEKGNNDAYTVLREQTAKKVYYTVTLCCDGSTSHSTGRGTCSRHGGVCGTQQQYRLEYTE